MQASSSRLCKRLCPSFYPFMCDVRLLLHGRSILPIFFFYSCSFPTPACTQTAAVTPETCVGSCSTQGIDQESMTESVELQPYGGFTMPLKSMFLSFRFAFLSVPAAFRRMDREIQSLIFKREGVTRSNAVQRYSTWAFLSNYSRRYLIQSISVLFILPISQRKNYQSAFQRRR